MDRYAFLLELNTGLNMKISDNEINGEISGLLIKVCFTPDGSLRVSTKAYLGPANAFREDIEAAFNKTSTFADFLLENEVVDLFAPKETLSMDVAFNIAQDIMIFATTLTALGYKSTSSPIDIEGGASTLQGEYISERLKGDDVKKDFYLKSPRMKWGILGAGIGTTVSLFLCLVAGMTNSWIFFIPAVFIVSFLQLALYELLAKERICFMSETSSRASIPSEERIPPSSRRSGMNTSVRKGSSPAICRSLRISAAAERSSMRSTRYSIPS